MAERRIEGPERPERGGCEPNIKDIPAEMPDEVPTVVPVGIPVVMPEIVPLVLPEREKA